jgi:hypothetical protein
MAVSYLLFQGELVLSFINGDLLMLKWLLFAMCGLLIACEGSESELKVCRDNQGCVPTQRGPEAPPFVDNPHPSTGGWMQMISYKEISLASQYSLLDVRSTANEHYLYLLRTVSNQIRYYEIQRWNHDLTNSEVLCEFLDDGNFGDALIRDGSQWIIPQRSGQFRFRRFSTETCQEEGSINTGVNNFNSNNYVLAGVHAGDLYFRRGSNLAQLDIMSQIITGEISQLEHGTLISLASRFSAMDVSQGNMWIFDGNHIWRMSLEENGLAWAKVSSSHVRGLSVFDSRLRVWSLVNNVVSVREWDVSGF